MSSDWKSGFLRVKNDVICLFDANGNYLQGLYNYKTASSHPDFEVYMPEEFYVPAMIDRPTRYLIHNNQIIVTKV